MKHIIKRSGKVQTYSPAKLKKSVEKTLLSEKYAPTEAKQIAIDVEASLSKWLEKKTEVTYLDIRSQTAKRLGKTDKAAGFLYKKYNEIW